MIAIFKFFPLPPTTHHELDKLLVTASNIAKYPSTLFLFCPVLFIRQMILLLGIRFCLATELTEHL